MKSLQSLRRLVQSLPVGGGDPLRAAKQDQYFPTAGDPRDGTSGRVMPLASLHSVSVFAELDTPERSSKKLTAERSKAIEELGVGQ